MPISSQVTITHKFDNTVICKLKKEINELRHENRVLKRQIMALQNGEPSEANIDNGLGNTTATTEEVVSGATSPPSSGRSNPLPNSQVTQREPAYGSTTNNQFTERESTCGSETNNQIESERESTCGSETNNQIESAGGSERRNVTESLMTSAVLKHFRVLPRKLDVFF